MSRNEYMEEFYMNYGEDIYDDTLDFQSFECEETEGSVVDEILKDMKAEKEALELLEEKKNAIND